MGGIELLNGLDENLLHVGHEFVDRMDLKVRDERRKQVINLAISQQFDIGEVALVLNTRLYEFEIPPQADAEIHGCAFEIEARGLCSEARFDVFHTAIENHFRSIDEGDIIAEGFHAAHVVC